MNMKMLATVAVLALIAPPTRAEKVVPDPPPATSCDVHGSGFSYTLEAPEGWVLECTEKPDEDVVAACWPKGSSWEDAATVMYVNDVEPHGTLDELVKSDVGSFQAKSAGLKVMDSPALPTGDGRSAVVKGFAGDANGNHESVAYISAEKVFVIVAVSSRSADGLTAALAAHASLVKSFHYTQDAPPPAKP